MRAVEVIEEFKKEFEVWKKESKSINPALFWSGKMSNLIFIMKVSSVESLSENLKLLCLIRDEYDNEIFKKIEGEEK